MSWDSWRPCSSSRLVLICNVRWKLNNCIDTLSLQNSVILVCLSSVWVMDSLWLQSLGIWWKRKLIESINARVTIIKKNWKSGHITAVIGPVWMCLFDVKDCPKFTYLAIMSYSWEIYLLFNSMIWFMLFRFNQVGISQYEVVQLHNRCWCEASIRLVAIFFLLTLVAEIFEWLKIL